MKRKIFIVFSFPLLILLVLLVWNFDDIQRAYLISGDINFYGKIIDESGKPIVGHQVEFSISEPNFFWHWIGYRKARRRMEYAETDAKGLFALEGERGIWMDVTIRNTETLIFNPESIDRVKKYPEQFREKYFNEVINDGGVSNNFNFSGFSEAPKAGSGSSPGEPLIYTGYFLENIDPRR
ncbi:hypothetical protein [Algisphaera agarilytica]|uniref:Uncharacterized protein n=1 Tax=Algisphaera agarilytica TaxID=1385975 RepID=A0A7X0H8X2_9BACT|nr:hypothetical protein [Algisphaera agarilytica]MBB6430266.1 hypothetical protein [Algisphaera agarilytica]